MCQKKKKNYVSKKGTEVVFMCQRKEKLLTICHASNSKLHICTFKLVLSLLVRYYEF